MSQYRTGTVDVTSGSNVVVGHGTQFLANVSVGDLFTVIGTNRPQNVGHITNDTQFELDGVYGGTTAAGVAYAITDSFTPILGIPYMEQNDLDTHTIFKAAMLRVEQQLSGQGVTDVLVDGTVASPGIQWFNENSTGFYRKAVGQIGVAILGALAGYFASTGLVLAGKQLDTATIVATGLTTTNNLAVTRGTITTSDPVTITQTWNAGGVTFTGLDLNVTSTASAAASLLANLRVGGTSQWKVDKSGNVTQTGTLTVNNATVAIADSGATQRAFSATNTAGAMEVGVFASGIGYLAATGATKDLQLYGRNTLGLTIGASGAVTVAGALNATGTVTGSGAVQAVFITGGLSGSQDICTIAGQASGSGPTITAQNSASNAYRPLTVNASSYDFTISGTSTAKLTSTGLGVFCTPGYALDVDKSSSGAEVVIFVRNGSNTAGSNAVLYAAVGGASAGDPQTNYNVESGQAWCSGVDNSDSDYYKICKGVALGTNDYFVLDTNGNALFASSVAAKSDPTSFWSIDGAYSSTSNPNYKTLTNNATLDLAVGSGLVIVHCEDTGEPCVFITWGGQANIISNPAGNYSSVLGTAGKINLNYNVGTGRYRLENKSGGTQHYYITTIRTRANS